jgi:release factor glutamine methyltransferase
VSPVLAPPRTIRQTLEKARGELRQAPFDPSPREAALLLGHLLGLGEASVLARYDDPLDPAVEAAYSTLMARRLTGEPVAYLLAAREFYGRAFEVDERVLVPRPETEHLVERALELDLPPRPRILDIGTGSGCLAMTLALERPDARVVGSDVAPGALALAARNRRRHELEERLALVAMDVASAASLTDFDLVVSNPPYIDPADAPALSPEVTAFEPPGALFAAQQGTAVGRRLLTELAPVHPGGHLLMEIGAGQMEALVEFSTETSFDFLGSTPDYAGIPRVLHFVRRAEKALG